MPEISKDWLEYEATHGGRFCLTGNAEEIIAQVQKLATAVGPPQPNTDPNLQIYDSSASSVPIRVYKPVNSENLPLCIFSHGGGFIAEDLDSEDGFCRWISKYTPCVVVSIDYRLGPKYKLPTMLEDVITAYDWVRDPSNRFVTEQTQIFAMGGSAGGALSLSLANHISEQRKAGNPVTRLAAVVALAPVILHPHHVVPEYLDVYKSYQENGTDVPIMDAAAMMTYFEAVNAVPNDSSIFAGLSPNLQDFPPTYIATCGADPLRDDGVVMAKMLEKAGVPIKHDHYPGLPHIFWIFPDFALSRVFAENLMMGIKFVLTKKRCHNAGAECVFDSRAPRQRRKRTDTRVAALEKEIAGLKAAIGNPAHESSPLASSSDSGWQNDPIVTQNATDEISAGEQPEHQLRWQEATENASSSDSNETIPGLVDATQLPFQLAKTLFTRFIDNVVPQYPVLAIGTNDDFSSLRITHPTLLLAIVTSASRGSDPALFRKLHYRLLSHVGHQVLVLGRRSLELVQAILAMEVWYDPPDDMDRLNFYMWIRISGIMVQQLGLWPWSKTTSPTSLARPSGGSDEKTLSEWRTAFAVFLSNSTVAISLRRPFTMVWSESMSDILDEFDRSCEHVNDKRLIAWVRLQVIAEEIETLRVKFMGVEERSPGTESPPADRSFMNILEGKLAEWRYANQSVTNSSLQIHFFYCRTKLYELAVFISQAQMHSLPIFPPRTGAQNHANPRQANTDMAYIRVVMSLIQSSHSILDTVIHFDIPTYLNCPTVTTVRALYAMQMIFTLYKSVKRQNSHIFDLIGEETLVAKFYANQIKDFFERAAGVDHFQVPRMALASLAKVTNYMLLSPSVETHQQDTSYTQDPDSRPGESRDNPPNDMDAILVTEIKSSGPSTQPSTTEPGTDLVGFNQEAAIEASFQPPPLDGCGLGAVGGAGDPSHIWSEFEIMALPCVAIDPSWLFPEEDYDLSHHVE